MISPEQDRFRDGCGADEPHDSWSKRPKTAAGARPKRLACNRPTGHPPPPSDLPVRCIGGV